jgi:lipid-binding SYLF domain-containing protein
MGTPLHGLQRCRGNIMKHFVRIFTLLPFLFLSVGAARAASYQDTIAVFKNAGASGTFFSRSYAYAIFPTVGSGALGVGGAYGKGRVYVHGAYAGNVTLGQVSVGFQAGGKAYSQIVFFEDKRALDEFESGNFEFGADASVVAITASANAGAATNGASSGVSVGQNDATTRGDYQNGMAVFTIAKGGLMYSASIAGQKFTYTPGAAH